MVGYWVESLGIGQDGGTQTRDTQKRGTQAWGTRQDPEYKNSKNLNSLPILYSSVPSRETIELFAACAALETVISLVCIYS